MKFDIFTSSFVETVKTVELSLSERGSAVLGYAGEVDRISRRLHEDSLDLAERCTRYAEQIRQGNLSAQPPSSYSTVQDIATNRVMLKEKLDALLSIVHLAFGQEFATRYKDAVSAKQKSRL